MLTSSKQPHMCSPDVRTCRGFRLWNLWARARYLTILEIEVPSHCRKHRLVTAPFIRPADLASCQQQSPWSSGTRSFSSLVVAKDEASYRRLVVKVARCPRSSNEWNWELRSFWDLPLESCIRIQKARLSTWTTAAHIPHVLHVQSLPSSYHKGDGTMAYNTKLNGGSRIGCQRDIATGYKTCFSLT